LLSEAGAEETLLVSALLLALAGVVGVVGSAVATSVFCPLSIGMIRVNLVRTFLLKV
jgi:hypothetical protein